MLLRALVGVFVVGLFGALLALSAGPNVDTLRAKVGAVLVILAIILALILTPIGFGINLKILWGEFRGRRHARIEETRALIADLRQPKARSPTPIAKEGEPLDRRE